MICPNWQVKLLFNHMSVTKSGWSGFEQLIRKRTVCLSNLDFAHIERFVTRFAVICC